jgi:hypothetical protein
MKPLLMMRTRGLTGPFFGRHYGNRASHPLASSIGNIGIVTTIIRWDALPVVSVSQGGAWTIDLQDYVHGADPITFAINTGGLPTGITLNANGTFSGTVTNIGGAGQVTFIATNATGSSVSGTLAWTIPA